MAQTIKYVRMSSGLEFWTRSKNIESLIENVFLNIQNDFLELIYCNEVFIG
jgi:hypothetical protein